ncbi:mannose-6-phosphate isomerase [Hymenopellis radicata]|nr:mannose-6-phosphate isomerase [Hymenopellis radicata]
MVAPIFKIVPTTQQYDWGKLGSSSAVAHLAAAASYPGFQLQNDKPYAEVSTSGFLLFACKMARFITALDGYPPHVAVQIAIDASLASYLKDHPSLLGENIIKRFPGAVDGNLPFLFKVLSIEKALSIQTHPDKATAEKLHAELPKIYKARTRPCSYSIPRVMWLPSLAQHCPQHYHNSELSALIPQSILDTFCAIADSTTPTGPAEKAALKDLFAALMTAEEDAVKTQLGLLVARYLRAGQGELESLVLRLNSQFPGDIGVFCAFILNYVKMEPGEAIFLGAGEPHAYVSGDIIECMANSDNVIRAGLTPKLRDIPNLIGGLTYVSADASRHGVQPTVFASPASMLYDPPIPEFSVVQVKMNQGEEEHRAVSGPSLVVVTEGGGRVSWSGDSLEINEGDVFFIGAETPAKFGTTDGLVMYRALVEPNN